MNKAIEIGRLTRDPEVRYSQGNNTAVARYTIAVDRKFKREGEQTADFIPCVVFGKQAEFAEKYFRTPAWRVAANADESLLAAAGRVIAPVFQPLGFGDWRAATALVTGLLAKETVLSTLGVLLGGELTAALPQVFSPEAAASFLVFTALYAPCVAAQAAMRQELGSRPAAFAAAAGDCAAAWCTAAIVYRIAIWI